MNRKITGCCVECYKKLITNKGSEKISTEEFVAGYDPKCKRCRETYKRYDRETLYTDKWYDFRFNFDIASFKYIKYSIGAYGLVGAIRRIFYNKYEWEYGTVLRMPLMSFCWSVYELEDLTEEWHDLDKLAPSKELSAQHQIKVIKRFYSMFGSRLKR